MKKRILLVLLSSLIVFGVLFGIMMFIDSPEDAVTTPKQTGEGEEIEDAFISAVGSNVDLQYPTEGDYKSAFIIKDIDNDDQDEALIFYTEQSSEDSVRMHILDKIDGEWQTISDSAGYGSKVDSIQFDDLNGDGFQELIISWSLYDSNSSRVLTVQSSNGEVKNGSLYSTLLDQPFTYMGLADMDGDSSNEIVLLWNETENKVQKTYASLLKMVNDTTVSQLGDAVRLDSNVATYSALSVQDSGSQTVVYIDGLKSSDTMITEVLTYNASSKKLVAPFTSNSTATNTRTLRTPAVPSMDVDGDGIIEVPVNYGNTSQSSSSSVVSAGSQTSESSESSDEERVNLISWCSVNPYTGALSEESYAFVNTDFKFIYKVSSGYKQNLMCYEDKDTGEFTIYSSSGGVTKADSLFTLNAAAKLSEDETYTFSVTGDSGITVYGTLTEEGKEAGFDNDKIVNNISFY